MATDGEPIGGCTFEDQNLIGGTFGPEDIWLSTSLSGSKTKGLSNLSNFELSNTLNGLDGIKNGSKSHSESNLEGL